MNDFTNLFNIFLYKLTNNFAHEKTIIPKIMINLYFDWLLHQLKDENANVFLKISLSHFCLQRFSATCATGTYDVLASHCRASLGYKVRTYLGYKVRASLGYKVRTYLRNSLMRKELPGLRRM